MATPTYPLTMPSTPDVEGLTWGLESKTLVIDSELTGDTQTSATPYALWHFDFIIPKMSWTEWAPWMSFFAQLRGQTGYFTFVIPGVATPRSGYTGTVGVVNSASQTGHDLVTDGWDVSETILLQGDLITVNNELKVVRSDVTTDVSGNATITFDPAIRVSPANNAAITINNPYLYLAADSDLPKWSTTYPQLTSFRLNCKERPV